MNIQKSDFDFKMDALDTFLPSGYGWNGKEVVNNVEEIPSETDLNTKIAELKAEYDALAWERSREENYPNVQELVVALYDTDDKADIEAKRASVKAKYPKPS